MTIKGKQPQRAKSIKLESLIKRLKRNKKSQIDVIMSESYKFVTQTFPELGFIVTNSREFDYPPYDQPSSRDLHYAFFPPSLNENLIQPKSKVLHAKNWPLGRIDYFDDWTYFAFLDAKSTDNSIRIKALLESYKEFLTEEDPSMGRPSKFSSLSENLCMQSACPELMDNESEFEKLIMKSLPSSKSKRYHSLKSYLDNVDGLESFLRYLDEEISFSVDDITRGSISLEETEDILKSIKGVGKYEVKFGNGVDPDCKLNPEYRLSKIYSIKSESNEKDISPKIDLLDEKLHRPLTSPKSIGSMYRIKAHAGFP